MVSWAEQLGIQDTRFAKVVHPLYKTTTKQFPLEYGIKAGFCTWYIDIVGTPPPKKKFLKTFIVNFPNMNTYNVYLIKVWVVLTLRPPFPHLIMVWKLGGGG